MRDAQIEAGDETPERAVAPEFEAGSADCPITNVNPASRWRLPVLVALAFLSGAAVVWSTAESTLRGLQDSLSEAQSHQVASDAIRTELVAELASQRQSAEVAERRARALEAELSVARVAANPQPVPTTTPAPPPTEPLPVPEPPRTAVALAAPSVSAVVVPGQPTVTADDALAAGRRHLRSGNLQAARQSFERAADLGLAEGALAMGTTFDPVTLAKAGIAEKGAPREAQRWYRRAYELSGKASQ